MMLYVRDMARNRPKTNGRLPVGLGHGLWRQPTAGSDPVQTFRGPTLPPATETTSLLFKHRSDALIL